MRVCNYGILGDNVDDVCNGFGMNVGVIDGFLEFLVESLIRKCHQRYRIDWSLDQ